MWRVFVFLPFIFRILTGTKYFLIRNVYVYISFFEKCTYNFLKIVFILCYENIFWKMVYVFELVQFWCSYEWFEVFSFTTWNLNVVYVAFVFDIINVIRLRDDKKKEKRCFRWSWSDSVLLRAYYARVYVLRSCYQLYLRSSASCSTTSSSCRSHVWLGNVNDIKRRYFWKKSNHLRWTRGKTYTYLKLILNKVESRKPTFLLEDCLSFKVKLVLFALSKKWHSWKSNVCK